MGDTLAKLKVILEASTSSYKKEMEKAQKVTKNVSDSVKSETSKVKQAMKMDDATESVKKQVSVFQKMKQAITKYQVKAGIKVPTQDFQELQSGMKKGRRYAQFFDCKTGKVRSNWCEKEQFSVEVITV